MPTKATFEKQPLTTLILVVTHLQEEEENEQMVRSHIYSKAGLTIFTSTRGQQQHLSHVYPSQNYEDY